MTNAEILQTIKKNTPIEEPKEGGRDESIELPVFCPTAERTEQTSTSKGTQYIADYPSDPICSALVLYPKADSQ